MFKTSIIAAFAASFAFASAAVAGDIGGGIVGFNASSFSGGAIAGGNVGGSGAGFGGAVNSTFTQSAHNEGLAGTIVKQEKLPGGFTTSIVSEHSLTGWTQQTAVQNTFGPSLTANIGAGFQAGAAASGGQMTGIQGYLNW
jgi:hypothetical protein